uniref:Uncharacterized protein n=1 Tax=Panagrolaimus sp. JU765 TaxID=591449 RepID=A0AC34QZ63_9BILA
MILLMIFEKKCVLKSCWNQMATIFLVIFSLKFINSSSLKKKCKTSSNKKIPIKLFNEKLVPNFETNPILLWNFPERISSSIFFVNKNFHLPKISKSEKYFHQL